MSTESSGLTEFPSVALPGEISIGEYGAQFITRIGRSPAHPPDARELTDKILEYHRIDGNSIVPILPFKIPSIRTANFQNNSSLLLQTDDEGVIKGMWDAFRESGWRGLEEFLGRVEKSTPLVSLYTILNLVKNVCDTAYKLKRGTVTLFFPHLGMELPELIAEASKVRNWNKSWTRAITWHPNFPKLALALRDDSIRICTVGKEIIPMLRSVDQKNVSCISWRPYIEVELAVGVEIGIVIWHMNSTMSIKPGACRTRVLKIPGHAPVTSLEYSKSGLLLLSSSILDTSIYIWDVSSWKSTPMKRIGGGGVPFACWSPFEDKILTTSPTSVFRIWEKAKKWAPRRWTTPSHPIEAACWTPDASILLFASGGMIYALQFMLSDIHKFIHEKDCIALPLYDLKECTIPSEDGKLEYKAGGKVRSMDLDPTANRLAVLFEDSELIAVFRIQSRSVHFLAPCNFIRGFADEYPICLEFQKDFKDGALLTIAWNSGRLQYFPFIFALPGGSRNLLHEDHYKNLSPRIFTRQPKQMDRRSLGHPARELFGPDEKTISTPNYIFRSSSFASTPLPSDPQPSAPTANDISAGEEDDFEYVSREEVEIHSPRLFSLNSRSPM